MDITCLVRLGQSSKTLTVSGAHKLEDVILALEMSPHFDHVFYDRFAEYVDLDSSTILVQYSKIKLLPREKEQEASVVAEPVAGPSRLLQFEPAELPQSTQKPRERYSLPRMPLHIENELKGIKALGDVTEELKRQIIDHMYFDLCTYTMYPGPLYAVTAQQLVAKYPALKDSSRNTWDVWRGHLRVKSKNKRRSMTDSVPGVGEARAKHQKAMEARNNPVGASLRHIARHMNGVTFFGDAEDEDSVAGHRVFMAKEIRKTNPDWQKIELSMECTFDERRHWMVATQPLVADIVSKYPALGYAQCIGQEPHRLTKCEISVELEEAVKKVGMRVISLAARKRRNKAAVNDLNERLDTLPEVERDSCFATGILSLLPRLLKEDSSTYMQKLDPGKVHMHPTVLFSGDTALSTNSFLVSVEDLTLDALDVLSSVTLMLSMYWAFNIKYATGTVRSFAVIERLIGIDFTPLTPLGLTVVAQLVPKK